MKYALLIVLFLFSIKHHSAQSLEQISNKDGDCQQASIDIANYLSEYYFLVDNKLNYKATQEIIDYWVSCCEITEPIMRLKILLNLYNGKKADSLIAIYNDSLKIALDYKCSQLSNGNTDSIFNLNKSAFGYIPFLHAFDDMSVAMAKHIQKTTIRSNEIYFINKVFALQFHEPTSMPEEPVLTESVENYQYTEFNPLGAKISFGIWTPLALHAGNFSSIPYIGVGAEVNDDESFIELNAKLRFHNDNYYFDFSPATDTFYVESNVGFNIGLKYGHRIFKINMLSAYINFGLGADISDTDLIKKEIYIEESDTYENTYYSLATIHASIGATFLIKTTTRTDFGFEVNLHKFPYNWSDKLISEIPTAAFSAGMFLRF